MSAQEKMMRARAALIVSQPFYGVLALGLALEEDPSVPNMVTDGEKIAFNPAFVDKCTGAEVEGVIASVVAHCAYMHHVRRGNRDVKRWDVACDHAINPGLIAAGFKLPKGALIDPQYTGLGAEEIYRLLPADDGNGGNKPGAPGAGNGPGGCGDVRDAAPASQPARMEAARAEWQAKVKQALAVARAHGAGRLPGDLARIAEEAGRARVDWRAELRRFIDQSASRDYSWSRPNRRFVSSGIYLPSLIPDALAHVVVVVDTSGSIDDATLTAFRAEVAATLDEGAADRLTVVYCDTAVRRVDTFERGDMLTMKAAGGGGTRFAPAFRWIADNAADASAVVYLTDLDCSDYGEAPAAPLIWAAWGDPRRLPGRMQSVPFGEVIEIAA